MIGLSGDQLIIDEDNVVKISRVDLNRFIENTNKHLNFNNPHIKAIPIFKISSDYIKMPLFKCKRSVKWLSDTNVEEIQELSNIIINYFSYIVSKSIIQPFQYKLWESKIDNLSNKIKDNEILEILDFLRERRFKNDFYYGECHGDFNLNNFFIISGEAVSIEVFDFLSSFIETPLNDIVKLRQDSYHLWALKGENEIDYNKVRIILDFIDGNILKFISKDKILNEYYLSFQIINMIRIIPYNKDKDINSYLISEIKKLSESL